MEKDTWTKRWDDRYDAEEFAYGEEPNDYLKEQLTKLKPGAILFPAEGEGRNAVFAAGNGWEASAFDISDKGRDKALKLAEKSNVALDYRVGELPLLQYDAESFDAIALIYAHFPAEIKSAYHKTLDKYLRSGGWIIFEAFSKKHLDYLAVDERVGGPKEIDMLFSIDEIRSDFPDYDFTELTETEIELSEGLYHNGKGSVIRYMAQKR